MINFSIVGRNCTQQQREAYYAYDQKSQERKKLIQKIKTTQENIDAVIGGQISIDIYPIGKNKSQILHLINGNIHFFGDRIEPGGNDYDLAKMLQNSPHKVTAVKNWQETMHYLINIDNSRLF
jgi:phosphomannomutase